MVNKKLWVRRVGDRKKGDWRVATLHRPTRRVDVSSSRCRSCVVHVFATFHVYFGLFLSSFRRQYDAIDANAIKKMNLVSLKLVKKMAEVSGKFIVMRSRQTHEASSASIQFIAIRREREVQSGRSRSQRKCARLVFHFITKELIRFCLFKD